jgi:ABC-type enterochelin transport system ATPase subunit
MNRKTVARALTLVRELARVLESLAKPGEKKRKELPAEIKDRVEAKICLVCGRKIEPPEPYRRGRCATDYQQFINDKIADPDVEKRYIAEKTLTPWPLKGGRPRRVYDARRVADAAPEDREKVIIDEALNIVEEVERRRKKKS